MPRGSNLRSNSSNPSAISPEVYVVVKDGLEQRVHILKRRAGKALVQYLDKHEQGDKWVQESDIRENKGNGLGGDSSFPRKLRSSAASPPVRQASIEPSTNIVHETATQEDTAMTEDDFNFQDSERKPVRAPRNIDKVNFGHWQIKTWYFSPYPLAESEAEDPGTPGMTTSAQSQRIQSINRSTVRSHGRASDLLTGGSGRMHLPLLWVCNRCFKYMAEGVGWELHIKSCTRKHPPGRKVYQRGAHTIWEVDGAKEKVYCQNLSLFGKLFIDVKTLFFDCDNFLFYLMTDGDSQRDHVLGFFSKEKMSYDDYNLACIITLPPYQRKGYGMLMIEFSYELSRRAGKVGTPERPLSDLGLRTYLTYWISTLVGFFRRLLSFMPPDIAKIDSLGKNSGLRSLSRELDDGTPRLRKKRYKGWEGEVIEPNPTQTPTDDHLISSLREIETTLNADGSATSHVIVRCTLADIARATNLRTEDVAFALHECGLLSRSCSDEENSQDVIAISREMVEVVAKERRGYDFSWNVMTGSTVPRRLAVLISGSGTNLQALIDAQGTPSLPNARICLVLSNRKAAYGLTRAANATPPIPTACLALQPFLKNNPGKTRYDYDVEISKIVLKENPSVIVLAGWMHVLGDGFLEALRGDPASASGGSGIPVINLHPALPDAFDGTNSIRRAYDAFQRGQITKSGVMVHRVIKEVDRGEPIIVREVMMEPGESFESFEARMHGVEWQVIVEATAKILDETAPVLSNLV